jgi:hypothetical protein
VWRRSPFISTKENVMPTEQAIATVIFLILLAICVIGLVLSSRNAERIDSRRTRDLPPTDPTLVQATRY